jgi:sialate O-acetylesterase
MTNCMRRVALVLALVFCAVVAQAEVTVSKVFGDHMVLQRDIEVPVWGWAEPGEEATVEFGGQKKSAKADKTGKWMVRLDAMKASNEGRALVVRDQGAGVRDQEAGVRSQESGGRSQESGGSEQEAGVTFTNVVVGEVWLCSGQSNMEWTMGGSKSILKEAIDTADFPLIRHINVGGRWSIKKAKDLPGGSSWKVCTPRNVGGFTAVGFFFGRKLHQEINVPIGLIKSAVGGTRIEPWTPVEGFASVPELESLREQTVGAEEKYRKQVGEAVVNVRQWIADTEKALETGDELYMPTLPSHPLDKGSKPTMLFNPKINPLVPYAMRGAIWYQGESNGGEGISYLHKTRALVEGWRTVWDQKEVKKGGPARDFPFYWVQLANFQKPSEKPKGGDGWARIRMAQTKALEIKNTGMAVAIELADEANPNDIHPKNKKDVGERLALWALAKDYSKKITCSGPLYKSMTVKGSEAIIRFDYAGKGLMLGEKTGIEPVKEVEGGTLKHFAISGEDGKWHWAEAKVKGKTVIVSSPEVAKPVAVRYAYTMNPDGCNLYNKAGLPASPFTTDEHWE